MIARRERWSYAAGDLGFNFVWQSIELYMLFFFVRELGLSPAFAAGIFLVGAGIDWLLDPLVGTLVDRAAAVVPLRLWVVIAGPLAAAALALGFAVGQLPHAVVPAAALTTFMVTRIAYAFGNIPYSALTARISAVPADHIALTAARMQGAAIGGLIAAGTYALLPAAIGRPDFRDGALWLAVLAVPAFLATYLGVRERVQVAAVAPAALRETIAAAVRLLRRSPAVRRLLALILTSGLAVTVLNKSLLFLFEGLHHPRAGFYVALVPAGSLLLTAPAWGRLGQRIGEGRTLALAALSQALAIGIALVGVRSPALVIAAVCLAIAAGAGLSVMFWSLVPVAVAECERHGQAAFAARVYALASLARKLAQGLAPSLVTAGLGGDGTGSLAIVAACALLCLVTILGYRPVTNGVP